MLKEMETLHFLPATTNYKHMYILLCAELPDSAMRAHKSTLAGRLRRELEAILGPDATEVECVEIAPLPDRRPEAARRHLETQKG